jgi:hypothetical protein
MRNYFAILLISMCLFACKHPTVFKEIQSPGKYSLEIPAYMHATNELFGDNKTCLQYENDSMQVYMLVFDTARKDLNEKSLKEYYDSIVAQPAVSGAVIASPKQVMVNGDTAMVTEMSAVLNKTPAIYKIEVIASSQRFYYILVWFRQDKKKEIMPDIEKMLGSFYDMNHIKV